MRLKTYLVTALAVAVLTVAAPGVRAQDTGSADFSRFVALGDSLAAGFTDGGLIEFSQEVSVPNLISMQARGMELEQPLVSTPGLPPLLALQNLSPVQVAPVSNNPGQPLNLTLPRPYDNLSVPGYTLVEAVNDRSRDPSEIDALVLRTPNTMLEQALALQPTFALVWLGNNDILGAAVSGRVIEGVTLTPISVFESNYQTVVGALTQAGADLALATLPDVTSIPFVSTVPPVLVDPQTSQPVLVGGQPVPLLGPGGQPLSGDDRVLLPATAALAQGIGVPAAFNGTGQGLPDELVLSAAEVATIRARTEAFNAIIRAAAASTGAALVELPALLDQAGSTGIHVGGITFTSDYITGGVFSLDGIHPTPFGYAYIANRFIQAINGTYGADIPLVSLRPYIFGSRNNPLAPVESIAGLVFTERAAAQVQVGLGVDRRLGANQPAGGGGTGAGTGGEEPEGGNDLLDRLERIRGADRQ